MNSSNDRVVQNLMLALGDGQIVQTEDGTATLRHYAAGDLIVTSGSIVAWDPCDPIFSGEEPQPFEQRVEPGRYPVVLSIAHSPGGDQRVAYATLRIRENEPVRWDVARLRGVEADAGGDGEYAWSYSVETGTGCFMDADVLRVAQGQPDDELGSARTINQAISDTYVNTWEWANVSLEPEMAANIVAFTSGDGDGTYLTYLGYDASNVLMCYTTDFGLFATEP